MDARTYSHLPPEMLYYRSMMRPLNYLWGTPSPVRVAASVALGAALGMLATGSPVWLVCAAVILLLRTHVPLAVCSWAMGWLASCVVGGLFEPAGRWVLQSNEAYWRTHLSRPVVCYLGLNQGRVMGSVVCGAVVVAVVFIAVLAARIVRRYARNRVEQERRTA